LGQIRFAVKAAEPSKRLEKHSFDRYALDLTDSGPLTHPRQNVCASG